MQIVNLDLLRCTGSDSKHADLFLSLIFTQKPMNDRKIERSDKHGFAMQQVLLNFVSYENKNLSSVTRHGLKFTNHEKLFDYRTMSVSQEAATGSTFSLSEPEEQHGRRIGSFA